MHISRQIAPKGWKIRRKETKWIARPIPGPHPVHRCITISLLLKDLLKYASTNKEIKYILNNKDIIVNKKIRTDHRFPIGIFDVAEIPKTKEYFRLFQNKKLSFILHKITKEESEIKPCKIINKTKLKGNKLQLNLFDGRNILINTDRYKVGDTIILDLKDNTIKSHFKFEKNAVVYLMEGKYTGIIAKIEDIVETKNLNPSKIICKTDNKKFETLKKYAFIIGDGITTPK